MKTFTPLLTILLTLTAFLLPSATAHKDKKKVQAEMDRDVTAHTWEAHVTNHMVFGFTLDVFMEMWHNKVGEYGLTDFDWRSDACTGVDDKPFHFNFKPACIRHDFGYRNFKRQERLGHQARKKIDKKFKQDMHDICDKVKHRKTCSIAAKTYYAGVRIMGRDLVVTTAADVEKTGGSEERSENWFVDWLADIEAHPEVLMEMTERELDNMDMALDAGLEEMDKEKEKE